MGRTKGGAKSTSGAKLPAKNLARSKSANTRYCEAPPELQLIYDTAPVGLAFLTPDCRYVQINRRLTEICGLSAADHIGRSVRQTVPQVADQVESLVQSIMRTGEPVIGIEIRGQRPDKLNADHVWITNWHPAKNADGNITGIHVVAEEVTELKRAQALLSAGEGAPRDSERKHAENELQAARRDLAQASVRTTLAAMMASIAHDINQPLTAIIIHGGVGLRWLARPELELDEVRTILSQIVESGRHASEIIANIRAMFRKEGRKALPLEVNDLVHGVLALAQGELELHRIVLHSDLHSDLPRVTGERLALQQVILHLIMNAVEAMSSLTDRTRLLSVGTRRPESGDVLITVTDCGTGIEQENLGRIFDPFFTTKPQGLGIGLSVCRSIVEAHGGRIWASPGNPHGAIFHVQLPIAVEVNTSRELE
jgi:PAS domain S-box-containing protein